MRCRTDRSPDQTCSISVILATYNGERYLNDQLASLAAQVVLPAELVVGDDGSTDQTLDIIKEFSRSSPFPVRLITRADRLGYGANFLATAREAVHPLLAFCDQDDIWHPHKLLRVSEAFATSPEVVLVAHQAQLVTADGTPIRGRMAFPPLPAVRYPLGTLPLPWYRGFSLTARAELLGNVSSDLGNHLAQLLMHDGWLWTIASCVGESVILPDVLVSYRQHDTSGLPRSGLGQSLHLTLEADADSYAYTASAPASVADDLNRLGMIWEEAGYKDRAAAARSRSAAFSQRAEFLRTREALYRSTDRRSAVRQLARLLRSGSYERPASALKDSLRILLGPTFWRKLNVIACRRLAVER